MSPVDFERYFTHRDGALEIYLGDSDSPIAGRISRSANRNATPRVYGNKALAAYFQALRQGGSVRISVLTENSIRIEGS